MHADHLAILLLLKTITIITSFFIKEIICENLAEMKATAGVGYSTEKVKNEQYKLWIIINN